MRRRLTALLIIVAVLALAWSGGWLALASWVEGRVDEALGEIAERGVEVECTGRDIVGFPFALKLACGETAVAERRTGSQAQLAGLTGGASVFAPTTAAVALASPARIESPLLTAPAELRWSDAGLDVGMGFGGPQTVSFAVDDLVGELPVRTMPDATIAAESAWGRLAPSDDGGTSVAITFDEMALAGGGMTLPPLSGHASARLSAPPGALVSGAGLQPPFSARHIDVSVTSGGARIAASGEVSVDAEGVLDGTIALRIAGTEALPALIATLPAEMQKLANAAVGGMLAFGQPTELDGEPATELQVEIEDGTAKVGPVSVPVPRLPL
jgi:hypothetical protein